VLAVALLRGENKIYRLNFIGAIFGFAAVSGLTPIAVRAIKSYLFPLDARGAAGVNSLHVFACLVYLALSPGLLTWIKKKGRAG